jgi:hypothetical protein
MSVVGFELFSFLFARTRIFRAVGRFLIVHKFRIGVNYSNTFDFFPLPLDMHQ